MTSVLENVETDNLHIILVTRAICFPLLVILKCRLIKPCRFQPVISLMYIHDTTGYHTSFHCVPTPEIRYRHVTLAVPVIPEQPFGTV